MAIQGEVSGLHTFGNGHSGFTLKDGHAILECVAFSDKRRALPPFENGSAVIATGSIRIRADRSGYQLVVEGVEYTGIGVLFAEYERLKAQFRAEGLFESARKRGVPTLLRRIALISARGKAAEDFVATIERNVPFVRVQFIETRVQGIGAEIEIAAAIDDASRRDVDAIVLTRGGGSYEDLFPFNREAVVRAIVRAAHPVLTAIAHSGDHHLADDAADMIFGTPSLAAEHVAKGWQAAQTHLQRLARDLERAARGAIVGREQVLHGALVRMHRAAIGVVASRYADLRQRQQQIERRNPQRVVADQRQLVRGLTARMEEASRRTLDRGVFVQTQRNTALDYAIVKGITNARRRFERADAALDRLDPLAPLRRGYAIVTKDGHAVLDASTLCAGDAVQARLGRGTIDARVETINSDG